MIVSGRSCLEEGIFEMAASPELWTGPVASRKASSRWLLLDVSGQARPGPPEDGEELYDEPCTPTNIESSTDDE